MRLYFSVKGLLTGCWLTWPLGHSSVGSCRPACVGGTRLPPSCPEPWPSSTCYRPRSWRCHCGHRSQPGCPSNTQTKRKSFTLIQILEGKSNFGDRSATAELQTHIKITPKLDVTVFQAVTADYSWTEYNEGFCHENQPSGSSQRTAHNISRGQSSLDSLGMSLRYF